MANSRSKKKDEENAKKITVIIDQHIDVLSEHVNGVFSCLKNIKQDKHNGYDDFAFLRGLLHLQNFINNKMLEAGVALDQDAISSFNEILYEKLFREKR